MKYCKLKILAFYTSIQLLLSFGLKGSIKGQDIKGKDNLKILLCCGDYVGREDLEEKDKKIKNLDSEILLLKKDYEEKDKKIKNLDSEILFLKKDYEQKLNVIIKKIEDLEKGLVTKENEIRPEILPPWKYKILSFFS